jgi:hypothetical protein
MRLLRSTYVFGKASTVTGQYKILDNYCFPNQDSNSRPPAYHHSSTSYFLHEKFGLCCNDRDPNKIQQLNFNSDPSKYEISSNAIQYIWKLNTDMNGQTDINIIFQHPVAFVNHLTGAVLGVQRVVLFLHWWLAMLTCITVVSSTSCDLTSLHQVDYRYSCCTLLFVDFF